MFRKGGSAGEGITSGLRQGYAEPGSVQQDDVSRTDIRNASPEQLLEMAKKYGYIGLTRLHVSAWDKLTGV